jgi:glycosyltransferase involved in cell wall biosynthesis
MRIAFTLVDARLWTGGYHYLLNLFRVLDRHQPGKIVPVLFHGTDRPSADVAPFRSVPGVEIVCSPAFNDSRITFSLVSSVVAGSDRAIRRALEAQRVDAVFEVARFFGKRLGIPAMAWMADFQHRALPQAFSRPGYWKRELGFRAQIGGGREVILSSRDAQQACERYYPASAGHTQVVHFATPPPAPMSFEDARRIADGYGLPPEFFFMPNQFWQHKNHLMVASAMAILRARGSTAVIAASGKPVDPRNKSHFAAVQAAIEAHGVADRFRILGMIPYHDLAALMHSCAALINPSRYEGWSTTVEEARSAGVPLILSDLPVHREQAGDRASYFGMDDPTQLADAIQCFVPLSRGEREHRALDARTNAEARVSEFAARFVATVESCLSRGPA